MALVHLGSGHGESLSFRRALASPTNQSMDPVPTQLGRYRVIGVLGRGGMATVYLANAGGEAGFSRLVAVKVLHPHLAEQEDFVTMLLDEARLAAQIHHPNVVPVVDLHSDGTQHYIVMEYVEGASLGGLLTRQGSRIPVPFAVRIVLDALGGLHAAHTLTDANGVPLNTIHRDVTPQNILVGVDGMARLTDFGIALAQSRIHHTRQGELKGKMPFMSPEQARGGHLDHRSDIFSLGCLLWSSFTGKLLFRGSSDVETLTNVINKEIPSPSTINPSVPSSLDWVCLRALSRDPDQRWSSAAEMEETLRETALSSNLLASRKEVGDWVRKLYQRELDDRRSAIQSSALVRPAGANLADTRSIAMVPPPAPIEYEAMPSSMIGPPVLGPAVTTRHTSVWLRVGLVLLGAVAASVLALVVIAFTHKQPLPGFFFQGDKRPATASADGHKALELAPPPIPIAPTSPTLLTPEPGKVEPAPGPSHSDEPEPVAAGPTIDKSRPAITLGSRRPKRPSERPSASATVPTDDHPPSRDPAAPAAPRAPAWDKDSPLPPP
jgi:serine/threonine protein kinase